MKWREKRHWYVLLGFLVAAFVVYAPALSGPFQFDDKRVVLDPKVRERRDVWGFVASSWQIDQDGGGPLGTRGLVQATFLINWQWWGEKTAGYHVFNVIVHVFSSWIVFILIRQLLGFFHFGGVKASSFGKLRIQPATIRGDTKHSFWLAVFAGAVFLLHPAQSQSVAYITQRFESMAALFYLLSVVFYLQARKQEIQRGGSTVRGVVPSTRWYGAGKRHLGGGTSSLWLYVGSFVAAFAAMSSKEIAVTLPMMLVLIELVVINLGKFGRSGKRIWLVLGLFFLLALKIPAQIVFYRSLVHDVGNVNTIAKQLAVVENQEEQMTRYTYLLTQFNVVRTYLRLLILPVRQSIDYYYPLVTSWDGRTVASFGLLVALGGLGLLGSFGRAPFGARHRKGQSQVPDTSWRLLGLGILWFYLTLTPTSTIIPIRDVIYEHRLYLPLVGFVLVLVFLIVKFGYLGKLGSFGKPKPWLMPAAVGLLVVYSILTFARSTVWASELKLWQDAWKKGPEKDRTNKNYGFVLTQAGRVEEGIERLKRAIEINPNQQDYYIALGSAYLQIKDWEKAREAFVKATETDPTKADGWNNLGVALFQLKQYEESKAAFEKSIEQDENFYMAWLGLGGVEMMLEEFEASEKALKRAISLKPDEIRTYQNLIAMYVRSKKWQKALEAVSQAEAIDPVNSDIALKKKLILKQFK